MSIYNISNVNKKVTQKRLPYKMVRIVNDVPVEIPALKDKREYAYSGSQARFFFLKKYERLLQDYLSMGYVLEVIFDNDLAKKEEESAEREKEIQKRKKREREEAIQEAWWQK